ncbi:MAG: PIN domain-containing protein [Treponema sp.]|jgi:PIN domain nuclease of toxin-antitoxin system|nr:PIN domain-containing protein [Treponema sp.]
MKIFILDACALIAYFGKEEGAEAVKNILRNAIDDENTKVLVSKINLLEVYYDILKTYDQQKANKMLETVKEMPIEIIAELRDEVLDLFNNPIGCLTSLAKYSAFCGF